MGVPRFPLKKFCLTNPKKFGEEPFSVPKSFGERKLSGTRGRGGADFMSFSKNCWILHHRIFSLKNNFVFQNVSGIEEFYA